MDLGGHGAGELGVEGRVQGADLLGDVVDLN